MSSEILIEKINLFFPVKLRPDYVAMVRALQERSFEREEQCADFVCRSIDEGATFTEAIEAWKKGPWV